jgi:hypothetical protein
LLFGPLSLGDDLLCTAVLREARQRGTPFAMMTNRPELFAGNPDPARLLPIDDHYVAALRRLGRRVVQPYYTTNPPDDPHRDLWPAHHLIAEMCRLAGLRGTIALRPYFHLSHSELAAGRLFTRQIVLQSSVQAARVPFQTKEWQLGRMAEVARQLSPEVHVIQLGSPSDPALPCSFDLRGKTTLRQTAAILANAEAFVGLEGFLSHLSRAVDCPSVVVLGGRAAPHVVGYACNANLHHPITCSPCGLRQGCPHDLQCMADITVAEVVAAARHFLLHPPTRPLPAETRQLS